MKLFRSLWICIALLAFFLAVGEPAIRKGHSKNPSWISRSRHNFIKRWGYGLRYLHLSSQDQWPNILKSAEYALSPSQNEDSESNSEQSSATFQSMPSLKEEGSLPPMDESVVNELSQPNMPTFQEFHAKVLGENQNKRRLDETASAISGQSVKGTATDSNLLKQPNQSAEDSVHSSTPTSSTSSTLDTSTNSVPLSENGGSATGAGTAYSDIILPSSVSENGNGNGVSGKRNGGGSGGDGEELRVMRNIAASECGAKLLQASPSAKHPHAILVDNNDEYMNQPCASEKWFIIETCEPVHLGIIQIANYELFSSRCKIFKVYGSDRYPAKQWEQIGTFQAQDVKGLQTFRITNAAEGRIIKYVKFEMLDHYGNEHFCPITMIRLFGLSSDDLYDPIPDSIQQPPAIVHQSSTSENDTTLDGFVSEPKGNFNASGANPSDVSKEVTTFPSPLDGGSVHEKPKQQSNCDPPVNLSSPSNEGLETKAVLNSGKSTGIWQHATKKKYAKEFVMSIIQSAIGGQSSSSHLQASLAPKNSASNILEASDPTSYDFYSVIYVFSQPDTLSPTSEPRARGLWYLGKCLLDLQDSTPTREVLASPSHRNWNNCKSAAYFLNLSLSSPQTLPQLARLASAYRNLTSVFGKWPDDAGLEMIQSGRFKSGQLPLPEFLKEKKDLLHQMEDSKSVEEESKGESKPVESSPEQSQSTQTSPASIQTQENPSLPAQFTSSEQEKPISPVQNSPDIQSTPEFHDQEAVYTEGGREVVLPAAMGGSWKETMYMRLNNKVLQLQSDVSVSMRYLEELSQSYKRQTERLSASFNITTAWLKATAKGAEERDLLQQVRIDALEAQLTKLLHVLAEQGLVIVENSPSINHSSSDSQSSSVPEFRRPFSTSSTHSGNLRSIIWSVFFQSPLLATSKQSGSAKFSGITTSSPCTDDLEGGRKTLNTNSALPLVKKPIQASSTPEASKSVKILGISPQASLLLNGGRQKTEKEDAERRRLLDDGGWKFMLVVAGRHLRNFVLSDKFHVWIMHVFFAVLAQIFVYIVFLRKIIQRCTQPSLVQSSLSTPVCCGRCHCVNYAKVNDYENGVNTTQFSLGTAIAEKFIQQENMSCRDEEKSLFSADPFPSILSTREDEPKHNEEFLRNDIVICKDDPNWVVRHRKLSPKIEDAKFEELQRPLPIHSLSPMVS
ncbi:unnamed protein product [Hymenolepis diminuta]|uniref:SUN domain-containing protein n=1 Tax=Hymenolepis diminuta TaxID=6216 RepID=A0A564YRX5_HYMDI|nr:unnamed protein product [Hymenolepis diminuta]